MKKIKRHKKMRLNYKRQNKNKILWKNKKISLHKILNLNH